MSSIERALHNEVARERAAAQALADDPAPVALAALCAAAEQLDEAEARVREVRSVPACEDLDPLHDADDETETALIEAESAVIEAARAYARAVAS